MNRLPRVLLLLTVLELAAAVSFAQPKSSLQSLSAKQRIDRWIQTYLNAHPAARIGIREADSYERLLKITAAKQLGIPLQQVEIEETPLSVEEPEIFQRSVNVSNASKLWQNETSVAIGRSNGNIIVAGANDVQMTYAGMPVYYSLDKGNSWRTTNIPFVDSMETPYGDPAIACGPDGTFYYAYLSAEGYNQETGQTMDNILVATSTDGVNWPRQSPLLDRRSLSGFEDKEQICVDLCPTSPTYGRVYVVWVHFNDDFISGSMKVSYSDDRAKTWHTPVIVSNQIGRFSQVRTGKNGELIITFSNNSALEHRIYVSTDGINFKYSPIASYELPPLNIDDRPSLKGDLGFRCYPYVTFDVDQKTNAIHLVYGSWYEEGASLVLYYVRSTNLGKTWTKPEAVGYSEGIPSPTDAKDRFDPWLSVRQNTSDVYLTYYSSERDPENLNASAHCMKIYDGNDHLRIPIALEEKDFNPANIKKDKADGSTAFIGDYIGGDVFDTLYAAVWTRAYNETSSDGEVYVYVGSVNAFNAITGSVAQLIHANSLRLGTIIPNPVSPLQTIYIGYYSPGEQQSECSLYSVTGVKVATIWNGYLSGGANNLKLTMPSGLAAGTYLLRLQSASASDEQAIVIR